MKVWPPGRPTGPGTRREARSARPRPRLADWVIRDEKLLVESRFHGDVELYRTWRDRLWAEMDDALHRHEPARASAEDETYVVMKAFDGDWAQYRVCRERLREELWQIMKVADQG